MLARQGDTIQFHPTLLELSAHYLFEPRPVAVARGNEKGRVERAIRYIRSSFFAGRAFQDIDDLNAQAEQWCSKVSADRRCPEDESLSVREAFGQEQPILLTLPDNPFSTNERKQVRAQKTPYIRFDLNDYSVPHTHVQKMLTVHADLKRVRILDGIEVIAEHGRSFDKGEQIEQECHINALWISKTKAREGRGQDRLSKVSSQTDTFLQQAVSRGHVLKTTINLLLESLDNYGRDELHQALTEALAQQSPYPEAVQQILERRRRERAQLPKIAIPVPDKAKHITVKAARLADYDNLTQNGQ